MDEYTVRKEHIEGGPQRAILRRTLESKLETADVDRGRLHRRSISPMASRSFHAILTNAGRFSASSCPLQARRVGHQGRRRPFAASDRGAVHGVSPCYPKLPGVPEELGTLPFLSPFIADNPHSSGSRKLCVRPGPRA
jgi:hypothetical protein